MNSKAVRSPPRRRGIASRVGVTDGHCCYQFDSSGSCGGCPIRSDLLRAHAKWSPAGRIKPKNILRRRGDIADMHTAYAMSHSLLSGSCDFLMYSVDETHPLATTELLWTDDCVLG